jgi:hypothetical protein
MTKKVGVLWENIIGYAGALLILGIIFGVFAATGVGVWAGSMVGIATIIIVCYQIRDDSIVNSVVCGIHLCE